MTIRGAYLNPAPAGTGTTLHYSGNFAGIADSPIGTMSFWFRSVPPVSFSVDNTEGYMNFLQADDGLKFLSFIPGAEIGTGTFAFALRNGTDGFFPGPGRVFTQDGNWHHLIMSWDTNHAIGSRVYHCSIDRLVTWTMPTGNSETGGAFTVPYSSFSDWYINPLSGAYGGNIAELWFAPGVQLDVSDPSVLDKFATSGGVPVSLGSDGSLPTGTAPRLYLSVQSSTANDFLTNRGSGGGAFVLDPTSTFPLALSDTDPMFDVPRLITGSRSVLTMRNATFPGLDLSNAFPNVWFLYFNATSSGFLNGDSLAIQTVQPQFDFGEEITPVTAAFASLHDDAVNFDSAAITPPVAGDVNGIGSFLMTKGASSVYLFQLQLDLLVSGTLYADVFPLTSSITPVGPITIPTSPWMSFQFANLRQPQQTASLIWWDGKEQCVGLVDSVDGSGKAILIDSAGAITDTKVWGGYTAWEDWFAANWSDFNAVVLTIPDSLNDRNYFITGQTLGTLTQNTVYAVTADTTGTELSRAQIYCDDLDVENIIRQNVRTPISDVFTLGFNTTAQGFVYVANDTLGVTYILNLNPQATTYTLYTVIPDPEDPIATALLAPFAYNQISCYVDAHHWLLLEGDPGTAILWDGTVTPPPVINLTGVEAVAAVTAPTPVIIAELTLTDIQVQTIPGPAGDDQITLSWSDDAGASWSNGLLKSLGHTGEYYTTPTWYRLGMSRNRIIELSWSGAHAEALQGVFIEVTIAAT